MKNGRFRDEEVSKCLGLSEYLDNSKITSLSEFINGKLDKHRSMFVHITDITLSESSDFSPVLEFFIYKGNIICMKYHIRSKTDGILYTIQKNLIMGLYRRLL